MRLFIFLLKKIFFMILTFILISLNLLYLGRRIGDVTGFLPFYLGVLRELKLVWCQWLTLNRIILEW